MWGLILTPADHPCQFRSESWGGKRKEKKDLVAFLLTMQRLGGMSIII
jgi:hypothetical protein